MLDGLRAGEEGGSLEGVGTLPELRRERRRCAQQAADAHHEAQRRELERLGRAVERRRGLVKAARQAKREAERAQVAAQARARETKAAFDRATARAAASALPGPFARMQLARKAKPQGGAGLSELEGRKGEAEQLEGCAAVEVRAAEESLRAVEESEREAKEAVRQWLERSQSEGFGFRGMRAWLKEYHVPIKEFWVFA